MEELNNPELKEEEEPPSGVTPLLTFTPFQSFVAVPAADTPEPQFKMCSVCSAITIRTSGICINCSQQL